MSILLYWTVYPNTITRFLRSHMWTVFVFFFAAFNYRQNIHTTQLFIKQKWICFNLFFMKTLRTNVAKIRENLRTAMVSISHTFFSCVANSCNKSQNWLLEVFIWILLMKSKKRLFSLNLLELWITELFFQNENWNFNQVEAIRKSS